MVLVVLIAICFSVVYFDYAVIVCCCMNGSYIFFRGISLFMGGYPSEVFIATVVELGDVRDLRATFWVYLCLMIVGFISSMTW